MIDYSSLDAARRRVRHAWRAYVHPALLSRDASDLLAALVVADACLDTILRNEGYPGETTGWRVRAACRSFSDYDSLRAARRIRHQAAHDLTYHLGWAAGAAALVAYTRALWEHGVDLGASTWIDEDIDVLPALVLLSPHSSTWGKGTERERAESR